MVFLAKENIVSEKFKILLSVAGILLSIFLILSIAGLYNGMGYMVTQQVLGTDVDIWVTSEGSYGSLHSPSLLPIGLEKNLSQIDGIQTVEPLIRIPATVNIKGTDYLLYINGYYPNSSMIGPWSSVEGNKNIKNGEIIIDRALASKSNLKVGDSLLIHDKQLKIVGISEDTSMLIAFIVFLTFDDALSFLPDQITSYYIIKTDGSVPLETIITKIEKNIDGVSAGTSEKIADRYKEEILGGFLPIVFVLVIIGVLVGILVIGMLVYNLTLEKNKEYGILKAIGAGNGFLYKTVFFQSLIISVTGFIIGVIIIPPVTSFIQSYVPEFVNKVNNEMLFYVLTLSLVTAFFAALIPVRNLSKIDPALVFKE